MKPAANENQVAALFELTLPAPGARLEKLLSSAPWTPRALARRHAAGVMLLLALTTAALFAGTPTGRAFAQSVFQFFVPAPAASFPILESQEFLTEDATQAPSGYIAYTSVEVAQDVAGFPIYQLPATPAGFVFRGISVQHDLGIAYTHYDVASAGGGSLMITQSMGGFPPNPWSEVPPHAIEKVTVAGMNGEYAQGMFVVYPDATSAVWEPDAPVFRLRWSDGSNWFSIQKHGDVVPIEWLDKDAMIQLAESLMNNR